MGRFAYVNGRYISHSKAMVHVEDRGYQFADGVYEVIPVIKGYLIDEEAHLDRLDYSLHELRIAWPVTRSVLKLILREVIRKNTLTRGIVYIQITRGVALRDHKFPAKSKSAFVVTTKRTNLPSESILRDGVVVSSQADIRWGRRDIKSLSLLPNVLAKQAAIEANAFEAWLVNADGFVTEGSSTNAYIIKDDTIITYPKNYDILGGITRLVMIQFVNKIGIKLIQRGFTLFEAMSADEAFLTSSSAFILPVTIIDNQKIGTGKPGPITQRLRQAYLENVERQIREIQ